MRIININGRDITILRDRAEVRYTRQRTSSGRVVQCQSFNKEILCWFCNKPKLIENAALMHGTALLHASCSKIVSANKNMPDTSPIYRLVKQVITLLNTGRVCKKYGKTNLTVEEIRTIMLSNCHYCGGSPKNRRIRIAIKYTGIDRVDSNKGYISGNCVPCCNACNRAKSDMTLDEFNSWIKGLVNYNKHLIE